MNNESGEFRAFATGWYLEEGRFTYMESGYRAEKVEVAYGWWKYTGWAMKFVFNHTLYRKLRRIRDN